MKIKILGTINEQQKLEDYLVRMTVSFGPNVSSGALTRREFIAKLRERAEKSPPGFLSEMFKHYADHIEAAAEHFDTGKYALDAQANLHIENAYYGEGSCSSCSTSHPGGSC